MQPIGSVVAIGTFWIFAIAALVPPGNAATLSSAEEATRVVSLQNVKISETGEVTGEVVNNSKQTVRDVRLQILHSWRWKDEFRPGTDDPGRAVYYSVDQEIGPGERARFTYKPAPPLPSRKDGHYDNSVNIVGFAQVYR